MTNIADGELTSLALAWRLERADGAGIALTGHDQALASGDTVFEPSPGMNPAAISRGLGLDPDSGEIAGALSSEALDEQDLALGRWDGARMQLTALDWETTSGEPIPLLAGEIGTVGISGDGFTADLRGAAMKLDDAVCPATSPECRARFGDKQCRVDFAGRMVAATVVSSEGGTLVLDRALDDRFVFGRLRYMSGDNCGLASVVLSVGGATVQLRDAPRAAVEAGCRVELREGCDKRFETCVSRFDNAVNFRGEPHLPGNDLLTRYPGA
jgi:uncharacterized phage protein (TIGR02218 family)